MNDQVLTVKEVAKYLKVNERTIYRMATSGELPAFKVGASWRFKSQEISEWIDIQHVDCSNSLDKAAAGRMGMK
ncbi:helix-turn-helix domain-containing protein [Roseibium aggregatum]|uniref:helix-turn-helix domain-containing protein n=1 Tax=Roseibium aggregatum TaxID=187304 RepID=UPI0025ABF59B|nr:helix-turn-helix domain-containing protein [Roseibium aggregatum]WJS05495.1 helix-turn-helix domain-containing protein [Roseibium aggregatum]